MKKLSLYVFLVLSLFFLTQYSYSKDMATWGPTGSYCKDLNKFLDSEEGKYYLIGEIRGFLNGLNMQLLNQNENARLKIINYNSIDYAFDYVINYCKQNPDGGVPIAVLDYFESLPSFKD